MPRLWLYALVFLLLTAATATAQQAYRPPRCEIVPLAGHQVSFQIDGVEKTRWHYGSQYPRPFFFPFHGPGGSSLTRMGHPGASNHDHHRSIWFAHHKLNGSDFWSDNTETQVRQTQWYAYVDGDDEARMACLCGWFDAQGRQLMEQEIVAALIALPDEEHALELQLTLRPAAQQRAVELEQTNFGFLAVRVAKSISAHFGGGQLTNSEGAVGEPAIFGKQARWMDYSGPIAIGRGDARRVATEGISYFDHPVNPHYPTSWHVRSDGWMGASFNMQESYQVTAEQPLVLRYLLHAHRGDYDPAKAAGVQKAFANRGGFVVEKSNQPHRQFTVSRIENP
jgi:hypothetical protein